MSKKCVRYILNEDGSTPVEILDGDHFCFKNSNDYPQDWDIIGITIRNTDYTGLEEYTSLEDLTAYVTSKGPHELSDLEIATNLWNKR
tara:strand:- start:434 stop:697 length:264 start_codon:yes stop_codon:yes gene_type:complete